MSARDSLRSARNIRTVTLITSDGLRWESEAWSAGDFDQTLKENRIIAVNPPGATAAGWHVRTSHVVAFRMEKE